MQVFDEGIEVVVYPQSGKFKEKAIVPDFIKRLSDINETSIKLLVFISNLSMIILRVKIWSDVVKVITGRVSEGSLVTLSS